MARRVVGLHIGEHSIKAVELERPDRVTPTLRAYHEVSLPEGAARDGEVLDEGLVALALKQLFKEARFKTREVVLGVGNQRVLVRDVRVPKMNAADLQEALPLQVEGLLPVAVEESILGFYPIQEIEGKEGPEISGLLVAAIKEIVETNVQTAVEAGLKPVSVDLIPFAIARLYNAQAVAGETVALIHIGSNTSYVVVVHDQVPIFVRIIPFGGDAITENIQRELGIGFDEAEALKKQYGIEINDVPDLDFAVKKALIESVRNLIGSFRSTKEFFEYSQSAQPVDRLMLSGGGSNMPGLAEQLEVELSATSSVIQPFKQLKPGSKLNKAAALARATDLAIPIGLALGGK